MTGKHCEKLFAGSQARAFTFLELDTTKKLQRRGENFCLFLTNMVIILPFCKKGKKIVKSSNKTYCMQLSHVDMELNA